MLCVCVVCLFSCFWASNVHLASIIPACANTHKQEELVVEPLRRITQAETVAASRIGSRYTECTTVKQQKPPSAFVGTIEIVKPCSWVPPSSGPRGGAHLVGQVPREYQRSRVTSTMTRMATGNLQLSPALFKSNRPGSSVKHSGYFPQ